MSDYAPPHNPEAEAALLSCMIMDPTLVGLLGVNVDDFYAPRYRALYRAIEWLATNRKAVDETTIHARAQDAGDGDIVDMVLVADVAACHSITLHAAYYADIVQTLGRDRRTLAAMHNHQRAIMEGDEDERTESEDKLRQAMEPTTVDVLQPKARDQEYQRFLDEGGKQYLTVPLTKWGEQGGGLLVGGQTIIGARPNVGKTAFALFEALTLALKGVPVLFLSLEMSRLELHQRLMAQLSWLRGGHDERVSLTEIRRRQVSMESLRYWSAEVGKLPLYIEDRMTYLPRLLAKTRAMAYSHRIEVVIVDHVGKAVDSRFRGPSRERETIGAVSKGFFRVSKDLGISTILLSQLNREAEGKLPSLSHLRMSGDLEQDADAVILLYREKRDSTVAEFIMAKGRDEGVFRFQFGFLGSWLAVANLETSHPEMYP